jgi:hypothetical protein
MKTIAILSLFAGSAAAFAPAPAAKAVTALNAEPPIGALPPVGLLGKNEWVLLTEKWGSEDTGKYLRAAELKHCRSAMLAVVGFMAEKFGLTFDKISPHEYLSVTQNVKFSDLAGMNAVDAIKAVPAEGLAQIFMAIAAVEIYELTHTGGDMFGREIQQGVGLAPGLRSGGLTGDLGFNPLKFDVTEDLQLKELQNGRAAMVAISGWVAAETIPGSFPLPLPW